MERADPNERKEVFSRGPQFRQARWLDNGSLEECRHGTSVSLRGRPALLGRAMTGTNDAVALSFRAVDRDRHSSMQAPPDRARSLRSPEE
jgi:hypothetical protein